MNLIYDNTINNYTLISTPSFYSFNKCNNVKILYEFQKKYYPECPSQISYTSNDIPYFCEAKCSKEEPFEILEEQKCTNVCGINSIFNQECKIKYIENDNNNENILLNNIKKDIITTNFDKQDLYNNKDIVIQEQYTKFIITTYKNNKIITIEENCINILEGAYNILNKDKLVILIIDIKKANMTNNKTIYEIYYDLYDNNILSKLDLTLCNNEIAKCSNYTIESLL